MKLSEDEEEDKEVKEDKEPQKLGNSPVPKLLEVLATDAPTEVGEDEENS